MSFIPMYILGLMGATRRLDHYDSSTGWQPFYVLMLLGGIVIMLGVALQLVQIVASVMQRKRLVDTTGDPWDGRSLEWSVSSPPPSYNFISIPKVTARDTFWEMKQQGKVKRVFEDIHMPKNTAAGIYISIFAFLAGFGFVWEIVWLVVVSIAGIIVCTIARTFEEDIEYTIPAAEVEKLEAARMKKISAAHAGKGMDAGDDMGLREFMTIVIMWAWDVVKNRRWRTW